MTFICLSKGDLYSGDYNESMLPLVALSNLLNIDHWKKKKSQFGDQVLKPTMISIGNRPK